MAHTVENDDDDEMMMKMMMTLIMTVVVALIVFFFQKSHPIEKFFKFWIWGEKEGDLVKNVVNSF